MALVPVEEALARVLSDALPTGTEEVALGDAYGRILAAPIVAKVTQPPFDASAMDGYAVRAADVARLPASLKVIGESAAGRGFRGQVAEGEAVRIFTGSPVPEGADAIVIQENTRAGSPGLVEVIEGEIDPGFVRKRGFDFAAGQLFLAAGAVLGAREVTLAAAMGHARLPVKRRPKIAILATGDELVLPGTEPGPDQIVCSNPYGLAALVIQAGGEPQMLGIARDTRASLGEKLDAAADADVVVTIGGASVGDHDLVGPVLEERGVALAFWKIAMRPGKPLMFGTDGRQRFLGMPGNPVSALICGRVFLVPLIRQMLGLGGAPFATQKVQLTKCMPANGIRQHYARAILGTAPDGTPTASPVRSQDSSLLSPLAEAGALVVQPPNTPAWPAGTSVEALLLDF
jgi:molybdopterin molybdotransferase